MSDLFFGWDLLGPDDEDYEDLDGDDEDLWDYDDYSEQPSLGFDRFFGQDLLGSDYEDEDVDDWR